MSDAPLYLLSLEGWKPPKSLKLPIKKDDFIIYMRELSEDSLLLATNENRWFRVIPNLADPHASSVTELTRLLAGAPST